VLSTNNIQASVNPTAGVWEHLTITRFMKLKSGEVVCPIIKSKQAAFTGPSGGVQVVNEWQQLGIPIGDGHNLIELPVRTDIATFIFLVRKYNAPGVPSDSPMRIVYVDPDVINSKSVKLNRFDTLPIFREDAESDRLSAILQTAENFRLELRK